MNKKQNSKKKKGFTLVEILVVIIVISVLSSIAVVQYQKSVLKSQFATLLPIAKALHESEELFAMSRGSYTDKLENLDASAGASGSTANINGSIVSLGVNNRHAYVKATKENFDNNLIMFQKGSFYFPGEIHCEAKEDKTLANWLCQKELGGTKLERSLTEGYTDYVIQGDGNGFFPKDYVNFKGPISNGDTCTGTEKLSCRNTYTNGSVCYGNGSQACLNGNFTNSACIGGEDAACYAATFYKSSCEAAEGNNSSNYMCEGSTFTNSICTSNEAFDGCSRSEFKDKSVCNGYGYLACAISTFEDSICYGNSNTACSGSSFTGDSICYANIQGACGGKRRSGDQNPVCTYEGNACCKGDFCPASAPKCDCDIDANTGQHALSC